MTIFNSKLFVYQRVFPLPYFHMVRGWLEDRLVKNGSKKRGL